MACETWRVDPPPLLCASVCGMHHKVDAFSTVHTLNSHETVIDSEPKSNFWLVSFTNLICSGSVLPTGIGLMVGIANSVAQLGIHNLLASIGLSIWIPIGNRNTVGQGPGDVTSRGNAACRWDTLNLPCDALKTGRFWELLIHGKVTLLLTAAFSKGSWWTLAYNWDQLRSSMRMATPRQK